MKLQEITLFGALTCNLSLFNRSFSLKVAQSKGEVFEPRFGLRPISSAEPKHSADTH